MFITFTYKALNVSYTFPCDSTGNPVEKNLTPMGIVNARQCMKDLDRDLVDVKFSNQQSVLFSKSNS